MADRGNMLSSKKKKNISSWRSSKKRKRKESSDDIAAMEKKKHNKTRAPNNGLLVDQAKSTNTEQLVISTTNVAAPDRSYLPTDIVEEIIDLLPMKSINRFRSVSKSLFTLLATKFNVPKLIYYPFITNFSPSNYGIKSSDNPCRFTGVVLSDYSGHAKNQDRLGCINVIWVMKEYCKEASWVPFISYTESHLEYVCDFVPRSFRDGRYMMLQFAEKEIHVLKWDNNLDESDEAEVYSKRIEFYTILGNTALPYTETVFFPYAS
ncbi:hypothetical protein Tsubulata_022807 [Turnera subulata]|uniref:F-box domain-containing protein n=1 Tax=Turnera subulata TaxID=218843 RepID=A0A9Q0IZR9_9ROSI|nr:hypothetical protein Tsubulata_022807 [Turnera subulata]